jgi:hypothetical protein
MKEHAEVKGRVNLTWRLHFPSRRSSPTAHTLLSTTSCKPRCQIPSPLSPKRLSAFFFAVSGPTRRSQSAACNVASAAASSPTCRNRFPKKNRQTVMRRLIMTTWHSSNDYRVPNVAISTDTPTIQSVLVNLLPHSSARLRVGKKDYEYELWMLGDYTDNTETGAPARTHARSLGPWPRLYGPAALGCTMLHGVTVLAAPVQSRCALFRPTALSSSAKRVVLVIHSSEQNVRNSGC